MWPERIVEGLRRQSVLLPSLNVVERVCAEAITRANRRIYAALTDSLTSLHRPTPGRSLNAQGRQRTTWLTWLRQSPAKPNSRHMLEHIERSQGSGRALDLSSGIERQVHQNRLLKIAREGGQMTPADLAKFEPQRRYAPVALALEGMATVTDEIIDLHDRILGSFSIPRRTSISSSFRSRARPSTNKVRLVRAHRPCLARSKTEWRRSIRCHRIRHLMGRLCRERHRGAETCPTRRLRLSVSYWRELCHPTPLRVAKILDVLELRDSPVAKGVLDATGTF